MGAGYGQFCPIAKAAEILCERWSPLVLRELMYGSRRFNDIARGVPLMSRALLATRLRRLCDEGLVRVDGGREYRLTAAGEALRPIIEQMGLWAQRWRGARLTSEDFDDSLLIWSLHRQLRVPPERAARTVLRFDFYGLPRKARLARRSWWLVAQGGEVEICVKDPGFEADVLIDADLRSFVEVALGHRTLREALKQRRVRLRGNPELVRELPRWLPLQGEARRTMGIAPGTALPA